MKFGDPILTSELSGALGGVVASSSRGGLGYFRVRRRPGNPRTPGMTTVRFILSAIAAAWRDDTVVTPSYRAGWEALAGPNSSGIDALVKGNAVAMLGGVSLQPVPPDSASLTSITPLVVDPVVDASAHTAAVTIPTSWDGIAAAAVFISAPQKSSRAARQFSFLFAGRTPDDATGAQTVAIPASHPAYNAVAGDIVYVRVVPFPYDGSSQPGAAGVAQEFRIIVAA